jgi:flagellar biosynthesis/type III secretory pathway protein FliH
MCPERMTLPRGIVALRPLAPAGSAAAGGEAARKEACVQVPPPELKEIQRRAFERGQARERETFTGALAGLLESLAEAGAKLDAMRAEERRNLARFGVEVAMAVARHVVGTAVAAGSHDPKALVEALLEEALPGLGTGPLQVAVSPADLTALEDFAGAGAPASVAGRIRVVADPALPRAACRIRSGGAETLADPEMRLAAIGEKLRALAGAETGGGDAPLA